MSKEEKEKDNTGIYVAFCIFVAFVFGVTSFALVTIFLHAARALESI